MRKIILLLSLFSGLFADSLSGDKSFTLDCTQKQTLVLDNALIVQNIGNQTLLYSVKPFSVTNAGFRLFRSDILILSENKKLYVKCLNNYGKAFLEATDGGY